MEQEQSNPAQVASNRRYLSPVQISKALGVGETTVKRWCDEGRVPTTRTAGGHRRILVSDVLALARQENWPIASLSELTGCEVTAEVLDLATTGKHFYDALLEGDPERARSLVLNAHQCGNTVARLADELICPVMARIGHNWASGQLDVYREHRATQVCLAALLSLKLRLESAGSLAGDQPLAMGGGPEFDHYLLPSLLIEMMFREMGWRVYNIGPNTPFTSMSRALSEMRPRLLWLSCSYLADPMAFLAGYRALYDSAVLLGTAVSVGGRALTEPVREQMTYTHHGDRLSHLEAFARELQNRR